MIELVHEVFASLEIDSRAKGLEMRVEATRPSRSARFGPTAIDFARSWSTSSANAVKFTDAGSIVVALSATRDAEGRAMDDRHHRHRHRHRRGSTSASVRTVRAGRCLDRRESTAATAWDSRSHEDWPSSSEVHSTLLHSAPGRGNRLSPDREASSGGARNPNRRRRARPIGSG